MLVADGFALGVSGLGLAPLLHRGLPVPREHPLGLIQMAASLVVSCLCHYRGEAAAGAFSPRGLGGGFPLFEFEVFSQVPPQLLSIAPFQEYQVESGIAEPLDSWQLLLHPPLVVDSPPLSSLTCNAEPDW